MGTHLLAQAQGLVCHSSYWIKCPNGEAGHWTANWPHIYITIGAAVVVIFVLLKLFRIKL